MHHSRALEGKRVQGMPGAQPHPRVSWAEKRKVPTSRQVGPKHPAFPAQWFTAASRSRRSPGLLASVGHRSRTGLAADAHLDGLDPSIGGPRPRDLTVRSGTHRLSCLCVHHIPHRRIVTTAKRPSCGRDAPDIRPFSIFVNSFACDRVTRRAIAACHACERAARRAIKDTREC